MQPIVIKKYANRRLYNTKISEYVTLNDLFIMVKSNISFKVLDVKTNLDITKLIMIQIILEQEGQNYNLLPVEFLEFIIKSYQPELNQAMRQYLVNLTQMFGDNKNTMQAWQLPMANIQELSDAMKDYSQKFKDFFNYDPDKK